MLQRILLRMKDMTAEKQLIRPVHGKPRLAIFTDGGFESSTGTGRIGMVIRIVGEHWSPNNTETKPNNIILFNTKRLKTKQISSSGPELLALLYGTKHIWSVLYLCRSLWGETLGRPLIVIDSKPVYDQLATGQAQSEPRLGPALRYTIEQLVLMNAEVMWSRRANQEADCLTRPGWPTRQAGEVRGTAAQREQTS